MDEARLNKLREELEKAGKKRDEWDTKVKNLERRYSEAEKVCVYGIFQAANLTPEQLAEVIKNAAGLPRIPGFTAKNDTAEDGIFEKEDNEE